MDNYEQNEQLKELKEVSIKLYNENKKLKEDYKKLSDNVNHLMNMEEEKERLYKKEIERLRELVEGERVYKERKCDLCRCGYYLTQEDDLWTDYGTCQECN